MKLEEEIKQKEFKNEYNKVIVNLHFTFSWLEGYSKAFFKKHNLTTQQYNILRILRGQHPKPATIGLLKERMLDKMSDASRLVDRIIDKGLIDRKVCKEDKRAVDIIITKKGLDLLSKIDKDLPNFEQIVSNLTDKEAKQLNELLDKLRG